MEVNNNLELEKNVMRIEVFSTIILAFKFCWSHKRQFYYLAFPAIIGLTLLSTVISVLYTPDSETIHMALTSRAIDFSGSFLGYLSIASPLEGVFKFLLILSSIYLVCLYSVAWHRFYLIPQEDIKIIEYYFWKNRHWQFIWSNMRIFFCLLPIIVLAFLATFLSLVLAPIIGIIMILFVIVFYARFSMWLPAVSLDKKLTLQQVLSLTNGNGLRLASILIITGLVAGTLDVLARLLIASASNSIQALGQLTQDLLTNLALYCLMFAGIAIGVTALSVSYEKLVTVNKNFKTERPD